MARADEIAALRKSDPVLRELIDSIGEFDPDQRRRDAPKDAYGALVRAIVGQQLSTKAARTIFDRLTALYEDRTPTPAELLATDEDTLRSVGLSRAKAAYLRDLAGHVESGELEIDRFGELSDEDVIAELIAVKGLGRWTADMFLIFHLGRPDVLPVGDLGVRRAIQLAYGLDELPAPGEMERIAEPWRPHRSLASLFLWRSLANEPV